MKKKEYISAILIFALLASLLVYKLSENKKRQIQIQETKKNLKQIGKQAEQYYTDADITLPDDILTVPNRNVKTQTWNFLEDQPNWILKPKPDYNEKTEKGLNIRISPSASAGLQNTKDSWSAKLYGTVHIQVGPVFEEVELEITLKNSDGKSVVIPLKGKLKEGINSFSFINEQEISGLIKDTEIRFYNKESRNLSSFTLIAIQLTP